MLHIVLKCATAAVKVAGVVSTALTPVYLWFFLFKLEWGLPGAAIACALVIVTEAVKIGTGTEYCGNFISYCVPPHHLC